MIKKILSFVALIMLFACGWLFFNGTLAQIQTGQIDSLGIHLDNASFKDSSVRTLDIKAHKVNFKTGAVGELTINTTDFVKTEVAFDRFDLFLENISLVPGDLISHQRLILKQPVKAKAYIEMSEKSLTHILNQPQIAKKMKISFDQQVSKLGLPLGQLAYILFSDPRVQLLPNNQIQVDLFSTLGPFITFPSRFTSQLDVSNGIIKLNNAQINASGYTLPPNASDIIGEKLNDILNINQKLKDDFDIHVESMEIIPHDKIKIHATAVINKLNFGKKDSV